jgi:CAAX protease family protein
MRPFSMKSAIIVLAIAAISLASVWPGRHAWAIGTVAVLLAMAAATRDTAVIHITLFCFLLVGLPAAWPMHGQWPWPLLAPLAAYGLGVLVFAGLRRSCPWFRPGRIDKAVLGLMLITIGGSALGLVAWYRFIKPDLHIYLDQMPSLPTAAIPFAGLGFALLNGLMEELAFRGIILHGCESALNNAGAALTLQAASFAVLHYIGGFPNGATGVGLTFVYGVLLGAIRNRSHGLVAPVVTHVFADLTIFAILILCL